MNKGLATTLSFVVASCGVVLSMPSHAATVEKNAYMDPSLSCQLSIPTTDTAIRPRATGFRNEGGVTTFVICGIPYLYSGAVPTSYKLVAASFDGAAHTFNCTGVSRFSTGPSPQFSVKSLAAPSNGTAVTATWAAADLTMGNFDASITCALPNGAAILSVQIQYNDEIGT